MESGIPTPPIEEIMRASTIPAPTRTSTAASTKPVKAKHRARKRSAVQNVHSPIYDLTPLSPSTGIDNRHKRVWKACERCRMKKTKCDGEFPCKRCKDDGLVCTAGTRKKTEYKQLPRGYAEVLENTQFALIATVHKLYGMVRNGQPWDLGEPELNDRGQPIIHNIATKLGCIRPNADTDLPVHSVFPEDERSLAKLAAELEVQQNERERDNALAGEMQYEGENSRPRRERASSSELDHSDLEHDYRKTLMSGHQNPQSLSPQSFASSYSEFEPSTRHSDIDHSTGFFSPTAPASYPTWHMNPPSSMNVPPQYSTAMNVNSGMMLNNQGLADTMFDTIKPGDMIHMQAPNPEVMLGMGDPMIAYSDLYESMDQ